MRRRFASARRLAGTWRPRPPAPSPSCRRSIAVTAVRMAGHQLRHGCGRSGNCRCRTSACAAARRYEPADNGSSRRGTGRVCRLPRDGTQPPRLIVAKEAVGHEGAVARATCRRSARRCAHAQIGERPAVDRRLAVVAAHPWTPGRQSGQARLAHRRRGCPAPPTRHVGCPAAQAEPRQFELLASARVTRSPVTATWSTFAFMSVQSPMTASCRGGDCAAN